MDTAQELAELFRRDITRLLQELTSFPDDGTLWRTLPGVSNSAGNLALHLEGNLREFVGRQLGGVDYHRQRDVEFTSTGLSIDDLVTKMTKVKELIPSVVSRLSRSELEATYPEEVLGKRLSTQEFLIHLYGHLNYHLGQIDYLRRISTSGTAVQFVGL